MSERFYVNLPLALGPFTLDGPEAHHLARVCRLRPGDEICLFNGDGHEYPARVESVARREIALAIFEVLKPERELPFALEVAAPVPKGDRGQFLVEKLTELGVTSYVPIVCQRSNVHPRECKREKLERYVIEASKQCGRNVLMRIDDMVDWATYCVGGNLDEMRVLAHPQGDVKLKRAGSVSDRRTRIAVGPEGGFTDEELALAINHGWQTMSLGPRILRVETAAIVAVSYQLSAISHLS